MSIVKRSPQNTNFLSRNRFKLIFPRAPNTEYNVQGINIPDITAEPVTQATPFVPIYVTGVTTQFSPVHLNIICDEDLLAWQEMHDWVIGSSFPRSFKEYAEAKKEGLYTDMSLMLMSNGNVPTFQFTFIHAFPFSLGAIDMTTEDDGSEMVTFPVTFRYTDYTIKRHKNP